MASVLSGIKRLARPPVFIFFTLIVLFSLATAISGEATDAPGSLESQGLDLPLVCRLGETCWVANYVDVDLTEAARDFRCQVRTYHAHNGTDFAIRDRGVMEQGVLVVSSAPGTVRAVRDRVEDVLLTDEEAKTRIAGKECGNGVVIDHEGGWQTQYCHLRRGSLRVRSGEQVKRGHQLGLVGLSGKTAFPHVHLTVRHNGQVVDPFTGRLQSAGCGGEEQPLWRVDAHVAYEEVALYNAGFSDGQPDIEAIRNGRVLQIALSPTATALVLWVDLLGVQAGDQVRFRVTGPDGRLVLDKVDHVNRTQARRFSYAGQHLRAEGWSRGTYSGQVTLTRTLDGHQMERSISRVLTIQ